MIDENTPLDRALKTAGGPSKAATALNYRSTMVFTQWRNRGIPADKVIPLARLVGWEVTPHELSPALYPNPDDGLPDELRGAA